jgi:peptide/nickel transport system substrate-binding protein
MKKLLLIPIFLVIIGAMVLGSCGPSETTTPTATQPTATQPTATQPTATQPTATQPTATQPTATPTKRVPTGTITAAIADFGRESTDPVNQESLWGWAMYDSLLRYDINGDFIPGVADSWTVSADGLTWTFKIHQGIKFWNGEALTADDVKFSVDRFGDMTISENPWSRYISEGYNKVSSTVIDEYTYEFVSAMPEPTQVMAFSWTRILPKDYYETVGLDGFRAAPMGSGPWKWVELIPETSVKLEANTEYWRTNEIPYYQYYVELQVPEESTRIAMLRTGEVDITLTAADRINGLVAEGFATVELLPPGSLSLTIQGTWLPEAGAMGNLNVRKAMSYALNRQEICDTFFDGLAEPGAQFYMYPGGYGWTDELAPDPYDPALAMQLLADVNYPDAFPDPTIHVFTTSQEGGYGGGPNLFLLLIDYWEEVGLQVEMEVVDVVTWGSYFFNFTRMTGSEPNVGWIFAWNYKAEFLAIYHSANMYTSVGVHNSGNDPVADELYNKALHEIDPVLGLQYYQEFQQYAKSMYVNFGIAWTKQLYLYNPNTIGSWANARTWQSYYDSLNAVRHPGE